MPRRWLIALAAIVGITLLVVGIGSGSGDDKSVQPQVFTLITGSARRVADGRAQIWLSRVNPAHRQKNGTIGPAAEVELTSSGESVKTWAVPGALSNEVFGCRVRLMETLDTRPPSARIEVALSSDYNPRIQSAAQMRGQRSSARHKPRSRSRSRRR